MNIATRKNRNYRLAASAYEQLIYQNVMGQLVVPCGARFQFRSSMYDGTRPLATLTGAGGVVRSLYSDNKSRFGVDELTYLTEDWIERGTVIDMYGDTTLFVDIGLSNFQRVASS